MPVRAKSGKTANLQVAGNNLSSDARKRLLTEAEQVIVAQGLPAVRTRDLVRAARVNISMITYYFGGIDGLIGELLQANVSRFVERQRALAAQLANDAVTLEQVLYALIEPLTVPAVHVRAARAAMVIQEVLAHADPRIGEAVETQLQSSMKPLIRRLGDVCPALSRDTVLWRFCCICGGGISMGPRAPAWQIYRNLGGRRQIANERDVWELVATAAGALSYGPARGRSG